MNVFSVILAVMAESVSFAPEDRAFVYAVARRFLNCPADADDVTQEALLLAYRHRDSFRGESRYRTWLYRIAVTTALGFLRKRRRSRTEGLDAVHHHLLEAMVDPADSPERAIADAEQQALVERALVELTPAYRDVLLARAGEATEPEIAARFGISVANVKIRTHRARKQLRATLDRFEEACAA